MSKYGFVKYVDTINSGNDYVEFSVTFEVTREVALEFMDALIPCDSKAKRDPIGAILDHSASIGMGVEV